MPRMDIHDIRAAGEYFIHLAKNRNEVPQDTATAKAELDANGVNVDDYENVVFIKDDDKHIHFIVREKEPILEAERDVEDPTKEYPFLEQLKIEYGRHFRQGTPPQDRHLKRILFQHRVGDYSVNRCM